MAKPAKAGAGVAAGGGDELIAAIKAKTGQNREERPGWGFDLAGDMLGQNVRPGEPDPWTAEQRENGVPLDFVFLNLQEHRRAEGRAGERFARFGGNPFASPTVLLEERAYVALFKVDGKAVPDDDAERERVWEALGHEGRAMVVGQYIVATAADQRAREAAAERARASFRVRA